MVLFCEYAPAEKGPYAAAKAGLVHLHADRASPLYGPREKKNLGPPADKRRRDAACVIREAASLFTVRFVSIDIYDRSDVQRTARLRRHAVWSRARTGWTHMKAGSRMLPVPVMRYPERQRAAAVCGAPDKTRYGGACRPAQ